MHDGNQAPDWAQRCLLPWACQLGELCTCPNSSDGRNYQTWSGLKDQINWEAFLTSWTESTMETTPPLPSLYTYRRPYGSPLRRYSSGWALASSTVCLHSSLHPSEADYVASEQFSFYGVRLLASRPTPNMEDQGRPSLSGSYPLTCPAFNETLVYRKPTHTNFYLNSSSHHHPSNRLSQHPLPVRSGGHWPRVSSSIREHHWYIRLLKLAVVQNKKNLCHHVQLQSNSALSIKLRYTHHNIWAPYQHEQAGWKPR
jgi:hypothetical protein